MFLSYADESGFCGAKYNSKQPVQVSEQPVQVMVAILINAYNFHRSDTEFRDIFKIINRKIDIREIKGEQIYRGRGPWEKVEPKLRDSVIDWYMNWLASRKHKLIVTAVDNKAYLRLSNAQPKSQFMQKINCPYLLAGLHTALVIQKLNRSQKKNKGKTILIFDEQKQYSDELAQLIYDPPQFVDNFVDFDAKKEGARLGQIIDTAFFVRSHHSPMTQAVDIVAYLFRLYLELQLYDKKESYQGETKKIQRWLTKIKDNLIPFNTIYPNPRKPFLKFLHDVSPKNLASAYSQLTTCCSKSG